MDFAVILLLAIIGLAVFGARILRHPWYTKLNLAAAYAFGPPGQALLGILCGALWGCFVGAIVKTFVLIVR